MKILPVNQPLHLRIVHKGKVIKTMNLAKPDPCLHIWHSSQPYYLEFFDPTKPEEVGQRSILIIEENATELTLDPRSILEKASKEPSSHSDSAEKHREIDSTHSIPG